MKPDMLIGSVP